MLTFPRLVLRNLTYHARGNLAVMLGVAVGSAVFTGALLVGDSLRGSLRDRVERQLGGVDSVAFFPRPVRAAHPRLAHRRGGQRGRAVMNCRRGPTNWPW